MFRQTKKSPVRTNAKNCSSLHALLAEARDRGAVVMVTVIGTGVVPFSVPEDGVTTHDPAGGAPEHANETGPSAPAGLVTLRAKVAP